MRTYVVTVKKDSSKVILTMRGSDIGGSLTANGILLQNLLDIRILELEKEDKFQQFCIKTFSDFYNLEFSLVLQKSVESGFSDEAIDFYDELHTFGPFQLIQEMLPLVGEGLDLPPFEEVYKERFILRLYHGSNIKFEHPDLTKALDKSDFGRGFYVTPQIAKAEKMAERKVKDGGGVGYLYEYTINILEFNQLNWKKFHNVNREWAIFTARCCAGLSVDKYELVSGPIADDEVYVDIQRYIAGEITTREVVDLAKPYQGYVQYAFCTPRALKALTLQSVTSFKLSIF